MASEDYFTESETGSDRRTMAVALATVGLFALLGITLYAYNAGKRSMPPAAVPVIKAQEGPVKRRPDDPGGIDPPHQDKLVFDRVAPGQSEPPKEQLRPAPEEPIEESLNIGEPVAAPEPGKGAEDESKGKEPAQPAKDTTKPPSPKDPVKTQTAPPPKPPSAVAKGAFRVQLASMKSADSATTAWNRLRGKHAELLGKLSHFIVAADLGKDRGRFYRLQVGPFSDRKAADDFCAELRKRAASCIVVAGG